MKISKSKQELARIISENGGWRNGEFATQNANGDVRGFYCKPIWMPRIGLWRCDGEFYQWFYHDGKVKNYFQITLSREEYLHLYPAPDADGWIEWKGGAANPVEFGVLVDVKLANGEVLNRVPANSGAEWRHCWGDTNIIAYRLHKPEQAKPELCESVVRSIPEPDEQVWTNQPTIEQLAADYRNAKDFADRKQQEADAARADADEKLRVLELAGEARGLLVTPITAKQEPERELVITVQVGDEVECIESNIERDKYNGMAGTVLEVDDSSTPYLVNFGNGARIWCYKVKFIRRP